jgi:Proto-chlorophyllide reductase 57 kD subunit
MKFLCVPCDSPMKLQSVGPPEGGSLSVVYSCPECGYEMAMLTNPFETQLVQSLGVRIGPDRLRADSAPASAQSETARSQRSSESEVGSAGQAEASAEAGGKCPFSAMIPTRDGAREAGEPMPVRWTAAAEARLANIPEFVRPMARTGIEKFARERGALEVDEKILDAARDFFGM